RKNVQTIRDSEHRSAVRHLMVRRILGHRRACHQDRGSCYQRKQDDRMAKGICRTSDLPSRNRELEASMPHANIDAHGSPDSQLDHANTRPFPRPPGPFRASAATMCEWGNALALYWTQRSIPNGCAMPRGY